ncbi:hypothetical protein [Pseudomonas putida]|uniref:hypothetical protein n=1 Tax=Pseudomonas putida TaxID=303 RepID=UPI003D076621
MPSKQFEYLRQLFSTVDFRQVGEDHAAQFGRCCRLGTGFPQHQAQAKVVGLGFPSIGQVAGGKFEVVLRQQAAPDQGMNVSPLG